MGPLQMLLVRHAEPVRAGTRGYGTESRPLSEIGFNQAETLARTLEREPVVAILFKSVFEGAPNRRAASAAKRTADRDNRRFARAGLSGGRSGRLARRT